MAGMAAEVVLQVSGAEPAEIRRPIAIGALQECADEVQPADTGLNGQPTRLVQEVMIFRQQRVMWRRRRK